MLLIAERLTPVTFLISSAGIPFALLSTIIFLTSTGTIFITSASYYTISFLFCLYWNCCKTGAKSSICSEHYEKNFLAGVATYSNVRIKTSNASSKLSDFGEGEGSLYTYTVPDAGTALDADGNEIPCNSFTTYFADDFKDEDITLSFENTDKCDFSMIYTNCMVSANGSKINEVDMKSAGAVELQADNSNYEVALTFNKGYYTMPWYTVSASGNKANTVSMEKQRTALYLTATIWKM